VAYPADIMPGPVEGEVLSAGGEVALVDHLPLPGSGRIEFDRAQPASVPATVVAAAGGFLLGIATFVLVSLLRRPLPARSLARRRSALAGRRGVKVHATRSLLIDVHVLKR